MLLGKSPTASLSCFRYAAKAGALVSSDNVYQDGDLTKASEDDEQWQGRGHTALICDDTFVRHWNTWTGPKRPSLFTAKLVENAEGNRYFGDTFFNVVPGM